MLGAETQRRVQALHMIRNVVHVERPKILFVGEQVQDFRCVFGLGLWFKRRHNLIDGGVVADDVHTRKDNPTVEVFPGIVLGQIFTVTVIPAIVDVELTIRAANKVAAQRGLHAHTVA